MAEGFKDLEVWQLGRELANILYVLTKAFPRDEAFGLTDQLRRASVSIPSNIAEGWGRQSDGSFSHFLKIARGSLNEHQTQVILACDFGYMDVAQLNDLEARIGILGRKLFNLTERLGGRYVREDSATYGEAEFSLEQSTQSIQPIPSIQSIPSTP